MALPRKLKNFNLFMNGANYVGVAEELTLPKITRKLEAYRGGGMNGSVQIDMGLDDGALDSEFTLGGADIDVYRQWGSSTIDAVQLRLCGAYQRDDTGETLAVEVVLRGRYSEIDGGNWKSGDNTQTKVTVKPTYYKLVMDGQEIIEIDIVNMVEKVDGKDLLQAQRDALGL